jgi:hypothetical protein
MITNITSKFFEDGKLVMKSMETKDQGCLGIGHTDDVEGSST